MYRLSDFLYLMVYKLAGYRKEIVLKNLRNSFPEKSEEEIKLISRKFYRYFCDLALETLKTLTISRKSLKKRVLFEDISVFENYLEEKQSLVIVMGHTGNWELAGQRFCQEPIHDLYIIYHPLRNKHFDKLLYHMRTRLGLKLYAMKDTLRGMIRNRNRPTVTAFITDQTPSSPEKALWVNFLNQDTPVFTGAEKIAKKMKYPVVYMSVKRFKRGYYRMESDLLVADPENAKENEITETHSKRLEQDIKEQPEIWLWTHRRWKHKRS